MSDDGRTRRPHDPEETRHGHAQPLPQLPRPGPRGGHLLPVFFGGELTLSTFGESGITDQMGDHSADDPAIADQVMHAMLVTGGGLTIMVADTPPGMDHNPGDDVAISLSGPAEDEAELRGYWEKLTEGAQSTLPLEQAPWGDHFGMCTDRFGMRWMVNIAGSPA